MNKSAQARKAAEFEPEIGGEQQNPAVLVELLDAIGGPDAHTQRSLSDRLGIALGLTNAILKRCIAKGLVKIQNAPARRYAYYVTPKGFAEKSLLVTEYLSASLSFFRRARAQYEDAFIKLKNRGVDEVALAGTGELGEVALLSASSAGLKVVAVIGPGRNEATFHSVPIVRDYAAARDLGAEVVAITDSRHPQATYQALRTVVARDDLIVPPLLHVIREPILSVE